MVKFLQVGLHSQNSKTIKFCVLCTLVVHCAIASHENFVWHFNVCGIRETEESRLNYFRAKMSISVVTFSVNIVPFPGCLGFDCLQYAIMEGEGLGSFVM